MGPPGLEAHCEVATRFGEQFDQLVSVIQDVLDPQEQTESE
jgi:hypothetical protein